MSRFFVDEQDINIEDKSIWIRGDDYKHIKKVLRLNEGAHLTISDGKGKEFQVIISSFESESVHTKIIEETKSCTEPKVELVLFQGIPKSDKMDLIIQKCVELGVNKIYPVMTERTVVKLKELKDIKKKVSRWQRISLEAAKQANRGRVPEICMPVSFEEAVNYSLDFDYRIIPYEKECRSTIKDSLINKDIKKVAVFIGPEGGFSEKEIEKAKYNDIISITLGPRILRTETAGLMVISILMYELGEL